MEFSVSLLWLLLANFTRLLVALTFSTVTEDIDLQKVSGHIAAFADFNSDKATDILVLNTTGQRIVCLRGGSKVS